MNYQIKLVSGTTSLFYIEGIDHGKIPNNISDTDTLDRSCSISIGVKECISGDTTWESYSSLNYSSFTLLQYGNIWDPYFTIN